MQKPPLRLERYFFTRIKVEANPKHRRVPDAPPTLFNVSNRMKQNKDNPRKWEVVLDIATVRGSTPDHPPYQYEIQAVGLFEVEPEVAEATMPGIIQVSGCSILYSAAREFLLGITGRGPFPPVSLATVSFMQPPKISQELPMKKPSTPKPKKGKN